MYAWRVRTKSNRYKSLDVYDSVYVTQRRASTEVAKAIESRNMSGDTDTLSIEFLGHVHTIEGMVQDTDYYRLKERAYELEVELKEAPKRTPEV